MKHYSALTPRGHISVDLPDRLPFISCNAERFGGSRYPYYDYKFIRYGRPKKGEYYVGGAIPAAYEAPNDISIIFVIVEPIEK